MDLKAKLDRVFSEYIRKRDSKDGYFTCISCGRILPYEQADCGHYINRIHMATRYSEVNCNAQCRKCLTPDALVLDANLNWVKLGDVKVGDKLLGFEEDTKLRKSSRRYEICDVLSVHREIQDVYEVVMDNGDRIKTTKEHQWLARRGTTTGYQWISTENLWVDSKNLKGYNITGPFREHVYSTLCKPFQVVHPIKNEEVGWLAGMIDADGHITQQIIRDKRAKDVHYGLRIGISQGEGEIAEKAQRLLEKYSGNRSTCRQDIKDGSIFTKDGREYKPNTIVSTYLITGTNVEKLEFLQKVRPLKIKRLDLNKLGKMRSQYDTQVREINYIGKEEVVVMETSTHTFFANGYAMHNCNRFDEGNMSGYRQGLIKKYGEQRVLLLEMQKNDTKKYSNFEYQALIQHYQKEIKKLDAR